MQMNFRLKVRHNSTEEWTELPYVFSTLEEAEDYRELGMAITGDQAEIVCEQCSAAVTHKLARINAAG